MKPLVFISAILLFVGIVHASPATTPLPEFKDIKPSVVDAQKVGVDDLCAANHSPAKNQTKLAFEAFKTAVLYMFASVINAEPTHSELQEAASWQLGQTQDIIKQALDVVIKDKSGIRRDWYTLKLRWLNFKVRVAKGLIGFGLPSWPWLGKVVEWLKKQVQTLKDKWNSFKDTVKGWFGFGDKKAADPAASGSPPVAAKETIVKIPPVNAGVSTEELTKKIEAETPTKGQMDAAVKTALDKSLLNEKNLPNRPLIKANEQPLSDEVMAKIKKQVETEIAKTDFLIAQLDTAKVC